ncbi:MAG: signal peptidase I [Treponema sp.]|nr:signal peptidase I [Treponema sp.]
MEEIDKNNGPKINVFLCVFIGIAAAFFAKAFLVDFYRVSGQSMEPSIKDGTFIAANKLAYGLQNPFKAELLFSWNGPKTGQAVLYMYQNYWVIKRCAAPSGSPLECVEENGEYFLLAAGEKIPLTSIQFHKIRTNKAVPKGYILAVGDNYGLSHDSRDYGFVPEKNVVARAIPPRLSRAARR